MADGVQPVRGSTIAFASTINGVEQEDLNKFQKLLFSYKRIDETELFSLINNDGWDLNGSGNIDTKEEFDALKKAVDDVVKADENDRAQAEKRKKDDEQKKYDDFLAGLKTDDMRKAVQEELEICTKVGPGLGTGKVVCKGVTLTNDSNPCYGNGWFNERHSGAWELTTGEPWLRAWTDCSVLELCGAILNNDITFSGLRNLDKGQIARKLNKFMKDNALPGHIYIEKDNWSSNEVIFLTDEERDEPRRPDYYTNDIVWRDVHKMEDYNDEYVDAEIGDMINSECEHRSMKECAKFILKVIDEKKKQFPNHAPQLPWNIN